MRTSQRRAVWAAGISGIIVAGLTTTGIMGASRIGHAAPQTPQTQTAVTDGSVRAAPMTKFILPTTPPYGAILLFTGGSAQIGANWTERYAPQTPAKWPVDKGGVATPEGHDITSRQSFGDCYLHAEFMIPKPGTAKMPNGGNAGFGIQGRYEIQVFDSYGKTPESHGCAALYSQKAALVNACKPAGEWQTYDIIFRAPRFGADGAVTEQARATVFQNGVLVQNNEAFNGPTGIQYDEYKGEAKTGPIVIQGNHDPIPVRNIWVVPIQ